MFGSLIAVTQLFSALALGPVNPVVEAPSAPEAWTIDPAHTEVNFSVRHFFTPVRGQFTDFEIEFVFDAEEPENSSVKAKIGVVSVDTGNERRDNHLRSGDWFLAEEFEHITFESTLVRKLGDDLLVTGDLTIKDVTRTVQLPVEILGIQEIPEAMQGMIGAERVASFAATLEIDRRDFGVGVGSWAETAIVGPSVKIEITAEAQRASVADDSK